MVGPNVNKLEHNQPSRGEVHGTLECGLTERLTMCAGKADIIRGAVGRPGESDGSQ